MNNSFDKDVFSPKNYLYLLELLSFEEYKTVNFATADSNQKHLILRHDIDFDLQAALKMAELEAQSGYEATYFVLLTSEFYNPFSQRGRETISAILSLGHEIGLHFDTSLYKEDETTLSAAAKTECSHLEQLTSEKVNVISMHRPPSRLVGEDLNFAGRLNTYAPRFTKEMGYSSDSRGEWRYGSPLESTAFHDQKALQLLTHPVWWTREHSMPAQQAVEDFLRSKQETLGQEAERNCSSFIHTRIKYQ
ncbi:MAG: hypothetical protein HON65_01115 [Rhodospirillales bacterium]|jgi:hypothetical protein|nr:hypothetical protein [Rhodospirillales bacterium]